MSEDIGAGLTPAKRSPPVSVLPAAQMLEIVGPPARSLAYLRRDGAGPPLVWLGGFRSDMRATKAEALDAWAAERGRAFLRFDYTGHGESSGRFVDGTISVWLDDVLAMIATLPGAPLLVGSSMGGWLALLAARRMAAEHRAPAGLVLIAPATDFTERLTWAGLDASARRAIEVDGVYLRPSIYSDHPVPITRQLIEDGRQHLLFEGEIRSWSPVHILQGMADPDVPWRHAMTLVEHVAADPVVVTLIRDGDHRLSRPQDIARLIGAIEGLI